jgi:Flp pilus assembly protein TadD
VLYSLAKQQYESGNFDKSRETTTQALALQPKNVPLRILSGKIAIEQAQLELAERELKLAMAEDPSNAEAEYLCGVVYQRWQQTNDAYNAYSRA